MTTRATTPPLRSLLGAAALGLLAAAPADAAETGQATLERLEQQVETLTRELQAVKARLDAAQPAPADGPAAGTSRAGSRAATTRAAAAPGATDELPALPPHPPGATEGDSNVAITGYGEINYYHPTHRDDLTVADLARAVFGFSYRFDDRTRFVSEFETEHAIASAEDEGEFEVEQFYVDRDVTDWATIKTGLFLIPSGLLNTNHEPTRYYGVQRNLVETLIIPTTWREGGVAVHGGTRGGLRYDVGVTTGFSLADWNANPDVPLYRSARELEEGDAGPLPASHQELSAANARHLSQYAALDYLGIPGLRLGGSVFTGKAEVPAVPAGLPDQRVTLWEGHARYTPGRFDLAALYARGTISNSGAFNLANAGASNPQPAAFDGWYLQAAYTAWRTGSYRLTPFARYEEYDLGASYHGIARRIRPGAGGQRAGIRPVAAAARPGVDRGGELLPAAAAGVQGRLSALRHQPRPEPVGCRRRPGILMDARWTLVPLAALAAAPPALYAATYLTVNQAQALMFPGETFTPRFVTLSEAEVEAVEHDAGTRVLTPEVRAWRHQRRRLVLRRSGVRQARAHRLRGGHRRRGCHQGRGDPELSGDAGR